MVRDEFLLRRSNHSPTSIVRIIASIISIDIVNILKNIHPAVSVSPSNRLKILLLLLLLLPYLYAQVFAQPAFGQSRILTRLGPCSVKIWEPELSHTFSDINVQKRFFYEFSFNPPPLYNCTQFCCYYLIGDTAFWIPKPYRPENVVCTKSILKCRNTPQGGPNSQKISRYCPTFYGLWGPLFVRAPVQRSMLIMPKSAYAYGVVIVTDDAR